jgi:hypothetical protein
MPAESSRSEAIRSARDRKLEDWFGKRRWRIATELNGKLGEANYREGEFWLPEGKVFRTPLGHVGRHGFALQEIDAQGNDVADGEGHPVRVTFGWTILRKAHERWPANVPAVRRPATVRFVSDGDTVTTRSESL